MRQRCEENNNTVFNKKQVRAVSPLPFDVWYDILVSFQLNNF